jgi:3-hydroxyacyl-CoA dehydrogenase/enoyl-CoA hydratase/3-hydroxybutyryl-CoA epimerase
MDDAVQCSELGDDGILVATMDLPGRPMNVVGDALVGGIATLPARLADPAVKGLILTSGKADFCAGATSTACPVDPARAALRRLDGAEEGAARHRDAGQAGGRRDQRPRAGRWPGDRAGLPRAHRRRRPALKLGQPEVKLGLLPGGGGTQRLPRLVGLQQALQICGEGGDIAVGKALGMGLLADTGATATS